MKIEVPMRTDEEARNVLSMLYEVGADEEARSDEANEEARMFDSDEANEADKAIFVRNLGWLLSQTREGVRGCRLEQNGTAVIMYKNGYERKVNINGDSYMAIIKDVAKNV